MHTRGIVALSVVLGLIFVTIMVVVARILWVHQRPVKSQKDERSESSIDPVKRRASLLLTGGALKKLFTPKEERGHFVPTLSSIIKAGDEAIYSSTLFGALQGHPGTISLETLHDAFANELRARPTSERSAYPPAISKYLLTTKKPLQRSQSVRINVREAPGHGSGRPELPPRPQARRTSIDLAEMGLGRSRSRRVTPVLVSVGDRVTGSRHGAKHEVWANDLQHALYLEGRPSITVTKSELAALSIILGNPLERGAAQSGEKSTSGERTATRKPANTGAHGISISGAATEDGTYHISLTQYKRSISQLPARGSGYSIHFAKYLACGSLPFASDAERVSTILITKGTLEGLRAGTALHLEPTRTQTPDSTFLTTLPNSKLPLFHTLTPSTSQPPSTTIPHTLLNAISALPFEGGLTPLASTPLIQTIRFIASGGLVPGRLLQRLDALVEKVHRHSPHLHLFGPLLEDKNAGLLFREREKLGRLATGALENVDEALTDKVARMHRYVTLIERLMYLVPDMTPQEARTAVKEEVRRQIEQAYHDAVAISATDSSSSAALTKSNAKRDSSLSQNSAFPSKRSKRSKRTSQSSTASQPITASPVQASRNSMAVSRCSSTFPPQNLGSCVEAVLKLDLPLDVAMVALVVRMVLVAWTVSVGDVAWEEGEVGFRVGDVGGVEVVGKMVMW